MASLTGNMTSAASALSASSAIDEASRKKAQALQQRLREGASAADGLNARQAMKQKEIDQKAKEFESVFLAEMFRPITDNLSAPEPFSGGFGEKMVQGLLLDEYAKAISDTGGIGIARHVKAEMIKIQGGQQDEARAALPGMEPIGKIARAGEPVEELSYKQPEPASQE
jgi:Rod binding domain-containing protein